MATRLGCRFTEHLSSQGAWRASFDPPCLGPAKRRHEATRVPGGTKQMRGLHDPGELGSRNEGDITCPSPSNNYSLLLIKNLVEHGGQILAEAGIGCFARHGSSSTLYSIPVRLRCTNFARRARHRLLADLSGQSGADFLERRFVENNVPNRYSCEQECPMSPHEELFQRLQDVAELNRLIGKTEDLSRLQDLATR